MSKCKRCRARGQTWRGSPPRCAFDSAGGFTPDNFMCATMNELRRASGGRSWSGDQTLITIPTTEGRFIVLGIYKDRGAVELARVIDTEKVRRLWLRDAEAALEALQ